MMKQQCALMGQNQARRTHVTSGCRCRLTSLDALLFVAPRVSRVRSPAHCLLLGNCPYRTTGRKASFFRFEEGWPTNLSPSCVLAIKALAGEWVQEIFKIIRGYGGAAIAATQDIGDLDRSRFGKGILNVAKTKIILNLENDEAQRVQHILHLSDAEIMSITRFERGQGLISTNSNHITVSFKASPLEKQLITTDRMELNQILKEKIAQNTHNVVE